MKEIKGYCKYLITKKGVVYNKKGKKLKVVYQHGRPAVGLYWETEDGLDHNVIRISKLVALTFIPNPHNYPVVMHLDNNPLNNHYKNLKWGTQQMNMDQMHKEKREFNGSKTELTQAEIRAIKADKYLYQRQLAELYSVSKSTISKIQKGKRVRTID